MDKIQQFIQYSKYPKSHQNKPKYFFFNSFAIYARHALLNKDFNFLKRFDTREQRRHCVQNVI